MNRKELRDAVLNLIIAGRDTTAQALSWTFCHVARRPELLGPIRKEAKEAIPDGKVTYDNFRSLTQANGAFSPPSVELKHKTGQPYSWSVSFPSADGQRLTCFQNPPPSPFCAQECQSCRSRRSDPRRPICAQG